MSLFINSIIDKSYSPAHAHLVYITYEITFCNDVLLYPILAFLLLEMRIPWPHSPSTVFSQRQALNSSIWGGNQEVSDSWVNSTRSNHRIIHSFDKKSSLPPSQAPSTDRITQFPSVAIYYLTPFCLHPSSPVHPSTPYFNALLLNLMYMNSGTQM